MCEAVVVLLPYRIFIVGHKDPNYKRLDILDHRLTKGGVNPLLYFQGKDNNKKLAVKLRNKYRVRKDSRS